MNHLVDHVRRFNRFYTARISVLDDNHLQSGFSLGEVRLLFELSRRGATTAGALAESLALDPGYLSRVVARLDKAGLVRRKPSPDDARQRVLSLTARGAKAFADLDARASAEVTRLLATASPAGQARVAAAMTTIMDAFEEPRGGEVALREPAPGDLGWIVQRHGELYAAEYGWNGEFEALVAGIVGDHAKARDPARERTWIAWRGDERVGCIMVVQKSAKVAQLRLLLVEPSARGLGVGGVLVGECIAFAKRAGYTKMMLWTQSVLTAAASIYKRHGFAIAREGKHRSFGAELVEQIWERELG